MKKYCLFLAVIALLAASCAAPKGENASANPADKILLKDFNPTVVNNLPVTEVQRAKYTIIDMHSHDYAENQEEIAQWVKVMDEVGVEHTAIMHCSWIGRPFEEVVEAYAPFKERFCLWCCFDYSDMSEEGIQKAVSVCGVASIIRT